ncbi:MAG: M81 family metallopeptidase [Verrucomicrobiaceae bacterium]|nr:M81 family metallopeptidase [Verrucomicrobiaceae bacterium]
MAGLFHETHTFLEGQTTLSDFHCAVGGQLLTAKGDPSPLGGVLALADELGWKVIPTVDYRAQPSAMVTDEVFDAFWKEFEQLALPALKEGVDAIYLVLHGAMVCETHLDVEGELLERIRALPGAEHVPIFGVFDLHAHFTERMTQRANCLVGYRENPHTDAREAACISARLLHRRLTTGEKPNQQRLHSGLIWPPTGTGTRNDPMKSLEALARQLESDHPELWSMSVVAGFAFGDTPDTGVCFLAVHQPGADQIASAALQKLNSLAHEMNELGLKTEPPVEDVLAGLKPQPPGLTVLVEPSENIGGGAPGDGTGLLRALIAGGFENAAVAIADPAAVNALESLEVGQSKTISIGGKGSRLDPGPLEIEVTLISRSDGKFQLEDPHSHLASMCGGSFDMGPTAVVRHQGVAILLSSIKTPPMDLGQWKSQGIDPAKLSIIGVKAAVAHRQAYDPIAARMLWVDTPGPCSSDLARFPFQYVRRASS